MKPPQEPEYDILNDRLIERRTGQPIPEDEPVLIVRASEKGVLALICRYLMDCESGQKRVMAIKKSILFREFRAKRINKLDK